MIRVTFTRDTTEMGITFPGDPHPTCFMSVRRCIISYDNGSALVIQPAGWTQYVVAQKVGWQYTEEQIEDMFNEIAAQDVKDNHIVLYRDRPTVAPNERHKMPHILALFMIPTPPPGL